MASSSAPKILAFKADAAIAKGKAVKFGSDAEHVLACADEPDKAIGICQNAPSAAEDIAEIAIVGGGAKGLAQTTIVKGKLLVSHTDGSLKPAAASGDRLIAIAMDDGVAGDLIHVEVIAGQAVAVES